MDAKAKRHMKRKVLYIALILAVTLIIVNLVLLRNRPGNPLSNYFVRQTSMELPNPLIKLGRHPQGSSIKALFKLVNSGNAPLLIEKVEVDCHCTSASYSQAPILPGDSTTITVHYDSTILGFFQKKLTLKTNTRQSPALLIFNGELY